MYLTFLFNHFFQDVRDNIPLGTTSTRRKIHFHQPTHPRRTSETAPECPKHVGNSTSRYNSKRKRSFDDRAYSQDVGLGRNLEDTKGSGRRRSQELLERSKRKRFNSPEPNTARHYRSPKITSYDKPGTKRLERKTIDNHEIEEMEGQKQKPTSHKPAAAEKKKNSSTTTATTKSSSRREPIKVIDLTGDDSDLSDDQLDDLRNHLIKGMKAKKEQQRINQRLMMLAQYQLTSRRNVPVITI